MSKNYTEQDIANLIDTFNEQATEQAPAPARKSTRRTCIVEAVEAPEQGYRVVLGERFTYDVEARDRGEAVIVALAMARTSNDPNQRNASAYIFMWNYTVTDTEGTTVHGAAMHEEVQAARIRISNERARANA